ncbi:MAG: amidohydrolase family protein [Actinomycetota bacterium]|nr:amidohydrolase family protein [Actinomycetota bacterium]
MHADEFIQPWLAQLRGRIPGLELFDAHTHIGQNDPDGFKCSAGELTAMLETAGGRAAVFAMHEPDGYRAANDATVAAAADSEGRLVAFCRLDPRADPLAEAERSLGAGAAGIKLHPRAEGFALDTPELAGVFALAAERRVPVLVHAGRGIPALGRHAVAICERHPDLRLILAHAGICDLAWIWRVVDQHPNLFFDTSWWSPSDLLALYALVAPRHILFASDAPYATPSFAAAMNMRYAMQAGLEGDGLRSVFGAQMARIISGEQALDAGPAPGPSRLDSDPLLDRVHTFLVASIGQMFQGVDPAETLALAALACEVGEGAPQADTCATVLELLELRRQQVDRGAHDERVPRFAPGVWTIVAAAGVTRTPGVPVPPAGEPATSVGERGP